MIRKPLIVTFRLDQATRDRMREVPIPSPAFRKGSHRGLARLFVAVRRRVILMMLRDDQRSNKTCFSTCENRAFGSPLQMLDWGT
jgi:hypothetical protein